MKNEQVLSCIQPTGKLHLGNYLGAIRNWVNLQKDYRCFFGIANLHATTVSHNAQKLWDDTINMVIELISCGVDPGNIFIQSLIPEHSELYWILGTVTPYGELTRQTQFKDKSAQVKSADSKEPVSFALFSYPVLQSSDVLLYKADKVPVGKDQKQHLELARNSAVRFNSKFGVNYFSPPECLFTEVENLKSLADPTKKMSKSLGDKHIIGLFDDEYLIRAKVRQAVTGTGADGIMAPGVENMFQILASCGIPVIHSALLNDFERGVLQYSTLKNAVTDALISFTKEFRRNKKAYLENRDAVEKRIINSSAAIRDTARNTLREVKEIVGLSPKFFTARTH